MKRESAVSKEVLAELSSGSGKRLTKAEKDERWVKYHAYSNTPSDVSVFWYSISWKKNEVADGEATTFSIFYNNTLYLFLVLGLFYFLNSFNPLMYPQREMNFFICVHSSSMCACSSCLLLELTLCSLSLSLSLTLSLSLSPPPSLSWLAQIYLP